MLTPDQVFTFPGYLILLAIVSVAIGYRIPQRVTVNPELHNPKNDWIFSSLGVATMLYIPLGIGFLVAGAYLSKEVHSGLMVSFDRSGAYSLSEDHLCVIEYSRLKPSARSDIGIMLDRMLSGQHLNYEPLTQAEAKAIADLKEAERIEGQEYESQDLIYKDAIEICMKKLIQTNLNKLNGMVTSMNIWAWENDPYNNIR